MIIALTSDRGLCGAIHTSIVKAVKVMLNEKKEGLDTKIVCVGDKSKSMLQRAYAGSILFSVNDVGKKILLFWMHLRLQMKFLLPTMNLIRVKSYTIDLSTLIFVFSFLK